MPMVQQCLHKLKRCCASGSAWPSPYGCEMAVLIILYACRVLLMVFCMHTEDAEHKKAGGVRKAPMVMPCLAQS